MIKALIFDWGNTVMVDFDLPGPMVSWSETAWIPGAEEALKILHEQYVCCIASNAGASNKDEMIAALKTVGADKYFHHFFHSGDIGYKKPDQRFFRKVCEEIGVLPGECVMIGDNYGKDIEGAKIFGMKTVFLDTSSKPDVLPHADAVILHMGQLPEAIARL
jgi:HAD superfamily hydrolase (TIGR01662 family)